MGPFSVIAGGIGLAVKELWGLIFPKVKSIMKFRSNLESLSKEMGNLENLGNSVKEQIEAAERIGRVPALAVTKWLQEFEEIKNKVNSIQASMDKTNNDSYCHPIPCCFRCTMGVEVGKNLNEVKQLIEAAGRFPSGVVVVEDYQVKQVEHIPGPSIAGQSTASENLTKVLSLLSEVNVTRIGVWGMGGVGKTTLVKNLNNKLATENDTFSQPFSIIIWATASKKLDLERLQTQLLERLNLEVKAGESMESTASRLYQRLRQEDRFLLILDDVWEAIDLDYLGVPEPECHMGYKIILTSRSLDVCRQMMTDIEVKVDVLNEDESWELFTKNAGQVASLQHIQPIARKISKQCSGLPLAIIIVGASMRGKTMLALWKDALNALQRSVPRNKGIEDKVYQPLKWSYDSLYFQGMDIKSCFLYCSLYPEDYSIEVRELVQCWIAEGFLDELQNYEVSVNRGIALVENLKDSCLLEDGIFKDTVKMHGVVRDVAIWIASFLDDGCKSFVPSGIRLKQISEGAFSETLNRISYMDYRIRTLPDSPKQCPKASSLLLQGNRRLKIVPEGFLLGFPVLRVLNLSGTRIHTLPLSLVHLHQLHALLLRRCLKLKELPPLGGLDKLQVLDCSQTCIEALPEGMETLTKLRLLDLSGTRRLRYIRTGIISRLSHLEIIYMTNSFYMWGAKGEREKGRTPFDELRCLDRLSVLYIHLHISCLVIKDLAWMERLKRVRLVIGEVHAKFVVQQEYDEKMVALCGATLSEEGVKWLKNASYLPVDNCQELESVGNMPTDLAKQYCFTALKSLTISGCRQDFPPARATSAKFDSLPNLEELILHFVNYEDPISGLVHHLGLRFSKLRTIRVSKCIYLRYLFSSSGSILALKNLKEVTISSCQVFVELFENASSSQSSEELEEILEYATSSHTLVPTYIVPNLQIMKLKELPKLKTLCKQYQSWQHLEQLEVIKCNQIKELPFTTQNANAIKEIRGESQWWNNLEWDDENTKSCLQQCFKSIDAKDAGF